MTASDVASKTYKWNRLNHDWGGGIEDGYAVCANCGCQENTSEAADVCWYGPAVERIQQHFRANLEESRKTIPRWMQDIFDAMEKPRDAP